LVDVEPVAFFASVVSVVLSGVSFCFGFLFVLSIDLFDTSTQMKTTEIVEPGNICFALHSLNNPSSTSNIIALSNQTICVLSSKSTFFIPVSSLFKLAKHIIKPSYFSSFFTYIQ